ncbi:MAG TPA: diaminopimelate epimerase [Acidimicrobiales bacterium]|nr:diaminopimelate epimerase [Acidimicrobiales bacterium]
MMPDTRLRLTKHHGAGNDFLVLADAAGRRPVSAAEARALCHRRLGVGADGLLRAVPGAGGADLAMELRNADGGEAEMSGNGIRCLVQAAVTAGWVEPGAVSVDTAAGRRVVHYRAGQGAGPAFARVAMGHPVLGEELMVEAPTVLRPARTVGMGNPHVVVLVSSRPHDDLVNGLGPRLERAVPDGANVEFLWQGPGPGELSMRVWERGVGETLACGTGTCAAVAAARQWGLVDTRVEVHNPGGTLEVELTDDGAVLGGPTVMVASIEIEESALARMASTS